MVFKAQVKECERTVNLEFFRKCQAQCNCFQLIPACSTVAMQVKSKNRKIETYLQGGKRTEEECGNNAE